MNIRKYLIFVLFLVFITHQQIIFGEKTDEIRYVPIGDSYTIGTGTTPQYSWPALLTAHLQAEGINIQLITNPARSGWTSRLAIEFELPIYKKLNPTFTTLMIGSNDWAQGVSPQEFRKNIAILLDAMRSHLDNTDQIVVINIPDFSYTPQGGQFGSGRNVSRGIAAFNKIISEVAHQRGIRVVDIYSVSQKMGEDRSLTSKDGLHPSAKGYALWEKIIYKTVTSVIKK